MTCLYEATEETLSGQVERCKKGSSMHRFEQSQEKKTFLKDKTQLS
jgi:hypothetical protein